MEEYRNRIVKCNCGRRAGPDYDPKGYALNLGWDYVPGEGWACPQCQRDALMSMAIDMGWSISDAVDYADHRHFDSGVFGPPIWAIYK